MNYSMAPAPYVRRKRSTKAIMLELVIALCVIWLASIVYYFTQSTQNGLMAILNVVIAVVVSCAVEGIFFVVRYNAKQHATIAKNRWVYAAKSIVGSYGYVSGIILALLLPVGFPIWALIVTAVFMSAVIKMLFGGFGHNIFNPAIAGRVFAQLCFGGMMHYDVATNSPMYSGATITTDLAQSGWNLMIQDGSLLQTLFLGNYRGTLGETFALLILLLGIVLAIRNVIDWVVPTFYIGVSFLASVLIGLFASMGVQAFEFGLVQICSGGLLFGAVFCLTDPVTNPMTKQGKIIYASIAALITIVIRIQGLAVEGVAYSILFMNFIVPTIDKAYKGLTTEKVMKKWIITGCTLLICIGTGSLFASSVTNALPEKPSFKNEITFVSSTDEGERYTVSVDGENTWSDLAMDVVLNLTNQTVVKIEVDAESVGASGGYGDYFLALTNELSVYYEYQPAKAEQLNALRKGFIEFTTPVPFAEFRAYDCTYFEKGSEDSDVSGEIQAGCTYTTSAFFYGVNRVIDTAVGGQK